MNPVMFIVALLSEPMPFTLLLALIVVGYSIYWWKESGFIASLLVSSLILLVASPLFFWVYGVTLTEYLLILIILSVPYWLSLFEQLHHDMVFNQGTINQTTSLALQRIEDLNNRLDSIENELLQIKLQTEE